MEKKFKSSEFGYEVTLGKFAQQADGAAWLQMGGTVVLSTVVSAESSEFPGFLPLSTDYRELYASGGKIPGGYLKREGRYSDKEILVSRLIDRAIRPLFPEDYFNQLQVLSTVYSFDKKHMPYTMALLASSIALCTSKVPFLGPVGAVDVGRIDGKWVVDPVYEDTLKSDVRITVAGTEEGINMVEGRTNEISEAEFIEAMFLAHDVIKKQIAWQREILKEFSVPKEQPKMELDWDLWHSKAKSFLTDEKVKALFISNKVERGLAFSALKDEFFEEHKVESENSSIPQRFLDYMYDDVLKKKITEEVFRSNTRVDKRKFDQIRPVSTEVGLLPFNHGSSLFVRGGTQALTSVTLGSGQDEQRTEDLMQEAVEKTFILHYNFHPFAVGEVKPSRGPGRREIGHGSLAASAFKYVLPPQEKFPYIIRIVTDILGSDGSSSMATVCGSTMALMDAGVPISEMVSGIAMGLLANEKGEFKILSDIAGIEDAFGLMDFKVAGTSRGITAIQMDIKYKGGLGRVIFENALNQAKLGRSQIMDEMRKVMSAPNEKLSSLVPQIVAFKIDKNKIGAVIGTGGKFIKEIIEKTGCSVDIDDDGTVKIFGQAGPKLEQAVVMVKTLAGEIEKGTIYTGKVKKIAEFGLFVEIAPGLDGLVHISNLPKNIQSTYQTAFKPNDMISVEVLDYDKDTGRIRLKFLPERPVSA